MHYAITAESDGERILKIFNIAEVMGKNQSGMFFLNMVYYYSNYCYYIYCFRFHHFTGNFSGATQVKPCPKGPPKEKLRYYWTWSNSVGWFPFLLPLQPTVLK